MNCAPSQVNNGPSHVYFSFNYPVSSLSLVAQQVQEMHNSLELQYWTRLSDMRHRYESTVPPPYVKAPKQLNGAPR